MSRNPVPISELAPPFSDVLAHWRTRGGDQLGCSWRGFDIHLLPPNVLPTTMVVDVFEDFSHNRFRYWGSRMTEIHGRDMTGQCPYDLAPPEFAQTLHTHHRQIVDQKIPTADVLSIPKETGLVHSHTVLRLPLSDNAETVSQIVVVAQYTDAAWKVLERNGGQDLLIP